MRSPNTLWRFIFTGLAVLAFFGIWTKHARKSRNAGSEIVVILASNDGGSIGHTIPGFKELVYKNRASYAQRHGYDFLWANITEFPVPGAPTPHWSKIPLLAHAFATYPRAQWLWWLDLDALIMTPSLPIHTLLSDTTLPTILLPPTTSLRGIIGPTGHNTTVPTAPATPWEPSLTRVDTDKIHMLITQDEYFGLNTGSFLIRRGGWAEWVLSLWGDRVFVEQGWVFKEQDALLHLVTSHELVRKGVGMVRQRVLNAYPAEVGGGNKIPKKKKTPKEGGESETAASDSTESKKKTSTEDKTEEKDADETHLVLSTLGSDAASDITRKSKRTAIPPSLFGTSSSSPSSSTPARGGEVGKDYGLGMKWAPGDLVVHLAGCGTVEGSCDRNWEDLYEKREVERVEDVMGAMARRRSGEWGVEVLRDAAGAWALRGGR